MWAPRKPRSVATLFVACVCALVWPGSTRALTDEELFRQLRFDLTHPGPRARALGGAFSALADDASGALANPAGLYAITRPEAFVEYRVVDRDASVVSSETGSLEVDPVSGARELPFLGVTSASDSEESSEPAFAGVALPFRIGAAKRPAAIFLTRRLVLSDERTLALPGTATEARASFESYPNTVNGSVVEAYSIDRTVTGGSAIEIDSFSVGAAFGVHPDFAVGASVTLATLDIAANSRSVTSDPLALVLDPGHPRLPSQPTGDIFRSSQIGTDDALTYTLGIHWHPDSVIAGGKSPWRLGAVLHKGAKFETTQSVFINETLDETFTNEIIVPDRFTLGVGYEHRERWTFALELDRIEYSDMLEGFRAGVNPLTSERFAQGSFTVDPGREISYTVDDATVPRLGVEYRRPARDGGGGSVAFRAGYWRESDSRIRMQSFNSTDPVVDDVYLGAFAGGEDIDHFTAGFGYGFGRFDLQAAADFSDEGSVAMAGVTVQWGNP